MRHPPYRYRRIVASIQARRPVRPISKKDRWNRLPAVPYGALDGDDNLAEMGPAGEVRVGVARPLEREDAVDDRGQRRVTAAFIATNISSDPT